MIHQLSCTVTASPGSTVHYTLQVNSQHMLKSWALEHPAGLHTIHDSPIHAALDKFLG
jgi:hypothetical protein